MDAIVIEGSGIILSEVKGLDVAQPTITAMLEDPWIELKFEEPTEFLILEIDIPESYRGDYFSIYHSSATDSPAPSYSPDKATSLSLLRKGRIARIIEFPNPVSFVRLDITEQPGDTGLQTISIRRAANLEEALGYLTRNAAANGNGKLVSTHDLSNTGAPHLAFHIAEVLYDRGVPVLAIACNEGDGALVEAYNNADIPLISFDTLQSSLYPEGKLAIKIQRICNALAALGYTSVFLNSLLSARYAMYYKFAALETVSLIHETAETILIQDWIEFALDASSFSDYLVFPSETVRDEFLELAPNAQGECLVRPQGVYQEAIQPAKIDLADFNIEPEDAVILGSGNCTIRKGYDLFVDAAIGLKAALPARAMKFIWTGDFGQSHFEKDYEMRLDAQVSKSGVRDDYLRVPFCPPAVYKAILDRADLFWCPSRDDTFPSVVLEAMLANVPAVAFARSGGVDAMLADDRGQLAQGFDVSDFVARSISLLEDEALTAHTTMAAYSWVKANLNFDDYVSWLLDLADGKSHISAEQCFSLMIERVRRLASPYASRLEEQTETSPSPIPDDIVSMNVTDRLLSSSEIKKALLDLLDAFDALCVANNLRYSLSGGTLLGAIRHGGFIPWDDDLDILMPRNDYEKLLSLSFPINLNGKTIDIRSNRNNIQPLVYAKIIDPDIAVYEPDKKKIGNLWIDIVPMESISDEGLDQARLQKATHLNEEAWQLTIAGGNKSGWKRKRTDARVKDLTAQAEEIYADNQPDDPSHLAELAWSNFFGGSNIRIFPASLFDDLIKADFEGRAYPIFRSWNEYLLQQYGEYWVIPSAESQRNHGMVAWRGDPSR